MSVPVKTNLNNMLHGVRGRIYIGNELIGIAQDISFSEGGEEDFARVMGSAYPQSITVKNRSVTGTIRIMLLDFETDTFGKLANPIQAGVFSGTTVDTGIDVSDLSTTTRVSKTMDFSNTDGVNVGEITGFLPVFDIRIENSALKHGQTTDVTGVTTDSYTATGLAIVGCVIVGRDFEFNKEEYWYKNIRFAGRYVEETEADVDVIAPVV